MSDAPAGRLNLTVLGSSSSIPRPGRACSGYLIEGAGQRIVADLGTGTFSNLRHSCEAEDLDAVVVSHMHADHFLDVVPLRYALTYGRRSNGRKVRLLLPPGGEAVLRALCDAFVRESPSDFLAPFAVETYDPVRGARVGDLSLRFAPTTHFITAFAIRCDYDGCSVTYSADTAPDAGVAALAHDTNLFVCEATLLADEHEGERRGHLSVREAAQLARDAAARRLLLTHYPEQAPEQLAPAAQQTYPGPIAVADDGDRFALGEG